MYRSLAAQFTFDEYVYEEYHRDKGFFLNPVGEEYIWLPLTTRRCRFKLKHPGPAEQTKYLDFWLSICERETVGLKSFVKSILRNHVLQLAETPEVCLFDMLLYDEKRSVD